MPERTNNLCEMIKSSATTIMNETRIVQCRATNGTGVDPAVEFIHLLCNVGHGIIGESRNAQDNNNYTIIIIILM